MPQTWPFSSFKNSVTVVWKIRGSCPKSAAASLLQTVQSQGQFNHSPVTVSMTFWPFGLLSHIFLTYLLFYMSASHLPSCSAHTFSLCMRFYMIDSNLYLCTAHIFLACLFFRMMNFSVTSNSTHMLLTCLRFYMSASRLPSCSAHIFSLCLRFYMINSSLHLCTAHIFLACLLFYMEILPKVRFHLICFSLLPQSI